LAVGAVTEQVEVTSQAPLLNADNANISEDLSARFAEDLPLNFRSVISLTLINSSVNNAAEEQVVGSPGLAQTADQDISFLNFGGTFFDTAEYLVDGTWDTRADWGGVIFVPSVDDVQELKIQTNAFTAQYGWSSGNVVNIVTKSGSNEFHGDAYEFYTNSNLDARYFFNNGAQPAFHRNQYGATIGGPIRRNKLYFFAYYEGLRQASPDTSVYTLPSTAERSGDFSAVKSIIRSARARLPAEGSIPSQGILSAIAPLAPPRSSFEIPSRATLKRGRVSRTSFRRHSWTPLPARSQLQIIGPRLAMAW
jgi:hypothetical protein